jgi:protein-L-isoaspartate(D-aspartate) O-methyltransferase
VVILRPLRWLALVTGMLAVFSLLIGVYNAALLAHLIGKEGRVTAIDVDADIVDYASECLAAAGIGNVEVVLGDGARGHEPDAPYNGIIASVGTQ